ncbi:MAG TPA: hypothetical protein VFV61_07720, partial [Pyrinomonadaceae bacterium]|nr:hypothetical protein [Pyrinomonadaceae bacterium]
RAQAAPALAGNSDLSGTWLLNVLVGLNTFPGTLILEEQQGALSGVLQSPFGVTKLERGSLDDQGFRFQSRARVEGRIVEMTIEGRVSGAEIRGTVRSEIGFARFTGTRQKS